MSKLRGSGCLATSVLLAAGAHAQANPCDQLKSVLAARIEASGVRGYTLETVPGGAAVPPDAKVIGTCQGGASKVLYRRWGATRPSSGGAVAAAPASAAQAVVVVEEEAPPSPDVQSDVVLRPEPAAAPAASASQPAPVPPVTAPLAQRASALMAENWRWIWALIALPVVGWLWAWRAHRSAYDEAGLPRGPKL